MQTAIAEKEFMALCEQFQLPTYCPTNGMSSEHVLVEFVFTMSPNNHSTLLSVTRHIADHMHSEATYDIPIDPKAPLHSTLQLNTGEKEKEEDCADIKLRLRGVASVLGIRIKQRGYISIYLAVCSSNEYAILGFELHNERPDHTSYYQSAMRHKADEWLGIKISTRITTRNLTAEQILGKAAKDSIVISESIIEESEPSAGTSKPSNETQRELCILIMAPEDIQKIHVEYLENKFAIT